MGEHAMTQPECDLLHQETLSGIVGEVVSSRDIEFEEDLRRDLAPGVAWQRRRLRFLLGESRAHERLCINELSIDPAHASILPQAAMDHDNLVVFQEIEDTYWATAWANGAIRGSWGLREPRLFVDTSPIQLGTIHDVPRAATRLHNESLHDSPQQHLRALAGDLDGLPARFAEGHNPTGKASLVRWMPAIPPSRLCHSQQADLLAVCAAGFYLNFPEEYADGYSALHQPFGATVIDGRMISPPWVERACVILKGADAAFRLVGPESLRLRMFGIPGDVPLRRAVPGGPWHGAVWRAWDPAPPTPPEGVAALIFSGAIPVHAGPAVRAGTPPVGGAIVWLEGIHARAVLESSARPEVELQLEPALRDAHIVSGAPLLVRNGEGPARGADLLSPAWAGEFRPGGPPPTRFPFDTDRTRAPRTLLGVDAMGRLRIAVVDGRRPGEHSMGLTLEGMSRLARTMGLRDAINLDGGGSAVLALEGVGRMDAITETTAPGVVSFPADGHGKERILPVLLSVVARPAEMRRRQSLFDSVK